MTHTGNAVFVIQVHWQWYDIHQMICVKQGLKIALFSMAIGCPTILTPINIEQITASDTGAHLNAVMLCSKSAQISHSNSFDQL